MKKKLDFSASNSLFSIFTVSKFVRTVCVTYLQKISDLLQSACKFSADLHISTHIRTSTLTIRLRYSPTACGSTSMRFFTILVHKNHTAAAIFDTFSKTIDVIFPSWQNTVTTISTGGDWKMTGHLFRAKNSFDSVSKPGFINSWCNGYLPDIFLQSV